MRIGLHIGDIITGVTGTNIVRFDFYGPDVKVANKMESEGIKGKINVSQEARKYIDKASSDIAFEYVFNKRVNIYLETGKSEKIGLSTDS